MLAPEYVGPKVFDAIPSTWETATPHLPKSQPRRGMSVIVMTEVAVTGDGRRLWGIFTHVPRRQPLATERRERCRSTIAIEVATLTQASIRHTWGQRHAHAIHERRRSQTQSNKAMKPESMWFCMWQWKRLRPG
jgi:hypothetical protein